MNEDLEQMIEIAARIVLADIAAGAQCRRGNHTYDYEATAQRAVHTARKLIKEAAANFNK